MTDVDEIDFSEMTLEQIKEILVKRVEMRHGVFADTSENSPVGLVIDATAKRIFNEEERKII